MAQSKSSAYKRSRNVTDAPTDVQIINGPDGKPAFVVIPYAQYVAQHKNQSDLIPHEVVSRIVDGASAIRAWREHLGLTQEEVAQRLAITQPAYAQQETVARPRKVTREKIALAFGISADQLEL
ncbi:helix-turn-helix domain-containing protein [Pseudomonas sp. ICMP 561]|uniref:helix-turn-helix domain-containing protein n=1 Tax=Pseudomonas sp. ICMP 561 TaxID=1718918 RepID=UPI000C07B869|nr:helix-turn-helix transcriptional regulator [Pseudomonas sp. ICMP 561]PHN21268.1 DNA-binding protein [Pseudomonas sp. ICMP 561]